MEKSDTFQEKLRALRKRLGMTQAQFADELKITRSYLSEIENGLEPSDRLKERIDILEQIRLVGLNYDSMSEKAAAPMREAVANVSDHASSSRINETSEVPAQRLHEMEDQVLQEIRARLRRLPAATAAMRLILVKQISDITEGYNAYCNEEYPVSRKPSGVKYGEERTRDS